MGEKIIHTPNKVALEFHDSCRERLIELCDPLKYLDISTFAYMKFYENSKYFLLTNHFEMADHYFKSIPNYGDNFSEIVPHSIDRFSRYIWPIETTDKIHLELQKFDLIKGVTLYRRVDDYVESWCFIGDSNKNQIHELFLNHEELLWKFAQYFTTMAANLIDTSDPKKLATYKCGFDIAPAKLLLQ